MALGDDYVSASWLAEPAYEGSQRRQWIAAQGPMDHTAHAFLSMFLRPLTDMSQNSKTTPSAVVALTRCVEDDEQKCAQYWPHQVGQRIVVHHLVRKAANESKGTPRDDASEKPEWIQGPFPPITVTLVWSRPSSQEDSKAGKGWRHNRLKIETFDPTANRGEGAKIVRFVDLIEYKEWPDFGVPQSVSRFLRFVRFTLSKLPAAHGSVVVHCHAGIGRTGTFCAIVWLIGYLKVSINSDGTCEIPKDRLLALEQASLASPLGPLERVRIPRMPVKHSKENPTASAQPSSAGDRSSGHAASVPLPASRSPSCDSRSSRSSTRQYRVGSSIGSTSSSGSISYETHPFDPIMAFVDILRDQRPHMVQTMGQLRYIYKVGRSLWNQAAGLPEESLSSRPVSSSSSVSTKSRSVTSKRSTRSPSPAE